MVFLFLVVTIHTNIGLFIPRMFVSILLYYCFRLPYYISILVSQRKGAITFPVFLRLRRYGVASYVTKLYIISPF